MDKVMFKAIFDRKNDFPKNRKDPKTDTALIQIEAYLNGNKKYFKTKIYITPDQWDKKNRLIKNHTNRISLNKQIRDFINDLEKVELNQRQTGKPFTLDYLSDFVKGKISGSFTDFYRKEAETARIKQNTFGAHLTTLKYLEAFRKPVLFSEVNYELLAGFETYLYGLNMHDNTIANHFSHIKRYLNLAINKGYFELNNYPFRKFKAKTKPTKRKFLTPEEIEKFENLRLEENEKYMQPTLDKFLFAIYTGLRYSDISELKSDNLETNDGEKYLNFTMVKTGESVSLPFSEPFYEKALNIFNNNADKEITVFPYQPNYQLNRDLVKLTVLAKVNKKVTFHLARHTNATFLLYKKVPITTVQKILGHRRLATTMIYADVMPVTMKNDLKGISFSK